LALGVKRGRIVSQNTSPQNDAPRLVMLRHGQASLGTADYDRLSPLGQAQAIALRDRLEEARLLNSPVVAGSLKRQQQTRRLLSSRGPSQIDESLNEYTVDRLIRSTLEQAEDLGIDVPDDRAFADPKTYLETFLEWFPTVLGLWQSERLTCSHNGRWSDFHARVTAPVPTWKNVLSSGDSLVVVSSAGVISTLAAHMLNEDLSWQRELNVRLYNASVTELSLDDQGRWTRLRINCVGHLEPDAITLA